MNEYDLYESGLSIPEVNEITGIPLSTIRNRLKKAGILRSRLDAVRMAASKGKLGSGLRGKKRPKRSKEWCEKISKSKKGIGRGASKKPNGYIEYTMGASKGRSVHVVLMEEIIGRPLLANECVHHINHDRADNRLENLRLMTRSEHTRLHAIENIKNRKRDERGMLT